MPPAAQGLPGHAAELVPAAAGDADRRGGHAGQLAPARRWPNSAMPHSAENTGIGSQDGGAPDDSACTDRIASTCQTTMLVIVRL